MNPLKFEQQRLKRNKYRYEWYVKNREYVRGRNKQYYQKNREKILQKMRQR